MTEVVVDASVVGAWLLADEAVIEPAFARGAVIGASLIAPSLLNLEFTNILVKAVRRGRLSTAEAGMQLQRFRDVPIEKIEAIELNTVLNLANRHGLSAYDAAYLALAQRRSSRLLTLDNKLAAVARSIGISHPE